MAALVTRSACTREREMDGSRARERRDHGSRREVLPFSRSPSLARVSSRPACARREAGSEGRVGGERVQEEEMRYLGLSHPNL